MDKILDVKIDNLTQTEIQQKVESFLVEDKPRTIYEKNDNYSDNVEKKVRGTFHQIATINPEFILEAQKNIEFRNILNSCDLNIADGFGIKLAFWRYGKFLQYRMAGVDLMMEILQIANAKRLSVFLAANKNGLSSWEETRDAILKTYSDLEIAGVNIDIERDCKFLGYAKSGEARQIPGFGLRDMGYGIVFCNFGAPQQEIFLNSLKNARIRLAMGVGGSFDYLTGKTPRAPQFLRQMGLEWLWRLILQPKRWKRISNAVLVFPVKIILSKEKKFYEC